MDGACVRSTCDISLPPLAICRPLRPRPTTQPSERPQAGHVSREHQPVLRGTHPDSAQEVGVRLRRVVPPDGCHRTLVASLPHGRETPVPDVLHSTKRIGEAANRSLHPIFQQATAAAYLALHLSRVAEAGKHRMVHAVGTELDPASLKRFAHLGPGQRTAAAILLRSVRGYLQLLTSVSEKCFAFGHGP